jgi:protein SCO1
MNRQTLLTVLCLPVLLCAASPALGSETVPTTTTGKSIAKVLQDIGVSPQLGKTIPLDLVFTDADGKLVRLGDYIRDRPVILHLVYYQCPMLCQLSRDGLLKTLDVMKLKTGEDFSVITVSFDPREGPEMSARARQVAAERFGREAVDRGWTFLTGNEPSIRQLCDSVGFRYQFDEAKGQYAHAAGIFVLTPAGTVSHYLSGVEYSPRDLRLSIVEASQEKVGTLADQVLLLCYMYDPTTGKYGLAIMNILRTAGAVTIVGMALAVGLMLRHERHIHDSVSPDDPLTTGPFHD